jgi:hypothetical protein
VDADELAGLWSELRAALGADAALDAAVLLLADR